MSKGGATNPPKSTQSSASTKGTNVSKVSVVASHGTFRALTILQSTVFELFFEVRSAEQYSHSSQLRYSASCFDVAVPQSVSWLVAPYSAIYLLLRCSARVVRRIRLLRAHCSLACFAADSSEKSNDYGSFNVGRTLGAAALKTIRAILARARPFQSPSLLCALLAMCLPCRQESQFGGALLLLLLLLLLLTDDILPTQVWSTGPDSGNGPPILGREPGPRVPVDVDLSEMEGEACPLPGKAPLCDEGTQMLTELLAETSWSTNAPVASMYSEASVSSCSSWLMGNISKKVFLITNAHLATLRACKPEEGPTNTRCTNSAV